MTVGTGQELLHRPRVGTERPGMVTPGALRARPGRPRTRRPTRQNVIRYVMARAARIGPQTVIDPRIDVAAQRAILRLARGTPRQRIVALGLLAAVRSGHLRGIYGDNLRAAAQLAAARGTVRWRLVPPGRVTALVPPGARGGAPAIVFRAQARATPATLDAGLRRAFARLGQASHRAAAARLRNTFSAAPNPWLCAMVCAFCAALIADGIPFDEVAFCALCLRCIAGGPN